MVDTHNAWRRQGGTQEHNRQPDTSLIRTENRRGVLICQMCLFPFFLWFLQMECISFAVVVLWNFWCKRHLPIGILCRPSLISSFLVLGGCSGCPPSHPPPAQPSISEGRTLFVNTGRRIVFKIQWLDFLYLIMPPEKAALLSYSSVK